MTVSTAVDASAVARTLGVQTLFKNVAADAATALPQRIAVIGQGASASTYATTKAQVTSAGQVADAYGYGSPLHLAVKQLFPSNGDGVGSIPVTVYPLIDDGAGVAAVGSITPSGSQTAAKSYRVKINNILSAQFTIAVGATLAAVAASMTTAINAVLEMPVIASTATTPDRTVLTAKWEGVSGNAIRAEIVGDVTAGTTFAVTHPVGGLNNPSISGALAQVGDVWETMVINCLDAADTVALDALSTFGEGRWGALTRKPLVAFFGNTEAAAATAAAVTDARKTDRTNVQLVAPGSKDLPFAVAARQVARIAVSANNDPARDYGALRATGLTPGADSVQWLYPDRDLAVKQGSSTVEVSNGEVVIGDVVTCYHPVGDDNPAFRYVCDVVKLQNILNAFEKKFGGADWVGAPLIPDSQPTVNPNAKRPKTAKAEAAAIIDALGLDAVISDPAAAKASLVAEIDSGNPKRLNLSVSVQLSGNTNIISVDLNFGFYFGG